MSENEKPVSAEMQDKPAPAETLTCRSCKECRGYKFCASRSRDYPCSCFILHMRREDKEFLKSQIENLKESAHERSHKCFAMVLMQIDYLNLKLLKAEKGCKKLREENRRLRAENQMLEDNMGNLLCTREEEMKYNRVLNENITKLAEVNALMAGKLSVYEPIKKAESQPDESADTVRESDPAEK